MPTPPRARPQIMGIVNATPDSFSDGGRFAEPAAAIAHAVRLSEDGADIIDIGGESTRPGADEVGVDEELARTIPVIEAVRRRINTTISIDTRKPEVARAAVAAGAAMWNDVTALTFDEESLKTAAALGCSVVLMHAQGDPKTMQRNPTYCDVVGEVCAFLRERIACCTAAGIDGVKLIVDPGIGFGKRLEHNLALIAGFEAIAELGPPALLGASRKRFIAAVDRPDGAGARLGGSLAAAIEGWRRGAAILRVHDVAATRQALAVAEAIANAGHER